MEGLYCFEQMLALNPNDAQANYFRGRALSCLGRHVEAVIAYDRSLALDPARVPARLCRADAVANLKIAVN